MTISVATPLLQINLFNSSLIPKRELFSARLIVAWVSVTAFAMAAVSWWAVVETRNVSRQVSQQVAYQTAARAKIAPEADGVVELPTPQEVALLEQNLQKQQSALELRRATLEILKRGLAGDKAGPSALMRMIAGSVPTQLWLTEIRVVGGRVDITGKTLDPLAVNVWLDHLRSSGHLAEKPSANIRLERVDAPAQSPARAPLAYTYSISATLASPFADEGGRQ